MSTRTFLRLSGLILASTSAIGLLDIVGPAADDSLLGPFWWFDDTESYIHLILAVFSFWASYAFSRTNQINLAFATGVLFMVFGFYNIFSQEFFGVSFHSIPDKIVHIVLGAVAFWVGAMERARHMMR